MKKELFLEKLTEVLQKEEPCKETDSLEALDSIDKISLMALFDKELNLKITFDQIQAFSTVADAIKLAGDKIEQ